MQLTQYNTMRTVQLLERDIKQGIVKDVRALSARCKVAKLPYSVYCKLYKQLPRVK